VPNFITEIDGLDIHFIHVRSKHENATRPQTLTALADSPVRLATFMIDHDRRSLELAGRDRQRQPLSRQQTCSMAR
jgi:hypothetical protein